MASTTAGVSSAGAGHWELPSRGVVGMACLIVAESAIFIIFIVAYVFYLGKSLGGPTPQELLQPPVATTICLLTSSFTVYRAVATLRKDQTGRSSLWLAATVLLAAVFLAGTAREWHQLIYRDGFTIRTNLFGTTFYSLVGLHASHVIAGFSMLALTLVLALRKQVTRAHAERLEVLSLYWHFVDAVWVVVFLVVYVLGRQG